MFKTVAAALVAVGLLAAPAFAQGNTTDAGPHTAVIKHKIALKTHAAKKHVALHHRRHVKHVAHAKHVKHHVKSAKHRVKTLKHQASRVKHQVRKAG